MGQFLLWVELVITSILWVALGQAICSRMRRKWIGALLGLAWCAMMLGLWTFVVGLFSAMYSIYPQVGGPAFWGSLLAGIAMLLGSTLTIRRAWRRSSDGASRRVMQWPAGKLALGWIIAVLVSGCTFWVMDQYIILQVASARLEAVSIAMAASPQRVPDGDNAAPVIDQAVGMLKALGNRQDGDSMETLLSYSSSWLKPDEGNYDPANPQMLAFVQNAQPAIALLQKGVARPGYDPGTLFVPPSYTILLPSLGDLRNAGTALCLSARVHADHGQWDQALAELHAAEALSRHVASSPTLITMLVGAGIQNNAMDTYQYLMDLGNFPANLPSGDWEEKAFLLQSAFPRTMQMERAMGIHIFTLLAGQRQSVETFESLVGGLERLTPVLQVLMIDLPTYRCFYMQEDLATYQDAMQKVQDYSALSHDAWIKKLEDPSFKVPEPEKSSGPMGNFLLISIRKARESLTIADARTGLMTLARGMIRYRAAHGKYPDTLDVLAPQYIAALPMDPFSGQPMKMMDKDGRRIIYSIGPDQVDDQGKPFNPSLGKSAGDIILRLPK